VFINISAVILLVIMRAQGYALGGKGIYETPVVRQGVFVSKVLKNTSRKPVEKFIIYIFNAVV